MKSSSRKSLTILIALILAFGLCGAFVYSYYNIYKSTRDSLILETEDKITLIAESVDSFLQNAKSTVATEAASAEYLMESGCSNEELLDYLLYQTDFQLSRINTNYTGVYGYYRGEYLDGNRWDPYADGGVYYPKERPWYLAAVEAGDKVGVASPYLDMDTGNVVLSVTKLLYDGESVLGMDISLGDFSGYINEYLSDTGFRYAYIIDSIGTVVASKDPSDTGLNYFYADCQKDTLGLTELFRRSLATDKPFEYALDGHSHLVISRTIENGWQVIALADFESVTAPLHRLAFMCIALLGALIALLLFFSIRSVKDSRLTREAQQNEQKYVDELQDYADQLTSYKRAILSDALIALEINLSRDELYYGAWKDDAGNEVPLEELLGLSVPCSYDEYIDQWNDRFVKSNATESFSDKTDRQFLIDAFRSGSSEVTFDYEAKTISGRSTWLRRSICMTLSQSGEVLAFTSVKDISALVEQNRREEAYIRALATEYDSIAVVAFERNKADDRVVLHSRVAEDFTALVSEELIGEDNFSRKMDLLEEFVYPEDRARFRESTSREVILDSFAENRTHVVDFRLMNGEGHLYYQMSFVPLREDDGSITGMIACLRNIDEEIRKEFGVRKELEDAKLAAESANRAKSTFLFNMSHDIRTPMNAIIGFTDIALKHTDDPERVSESLGKVKSSSEHLLSLINDVLDMSRLESGQVKIEEEPLCIDTEAENLYNILVGTAEAKDISLVSSIAPSLTHHWVYADRLRLMRVLTNIVSNSVKYTNPGGRIDILAEELPCEREGCARIRYTVTDTGIGMSREYLEHVFEPFSRAESATRSGVIGTGLGMAITRSLVELMGGTIAIQSELGKGTSVAIELEHRIAEPEKAAAAESAEAFGILAGKKILLVEDNELNREIATDILEEEGILVDTAEDGDIAVSKLESAAPGQYDLILMDIQMPRMNGYEAARAIRALPDPCAARIPIIAMTANAFDEDKQNAFEAGMNGHIAKPIDVPTLLKALGELLK